MGFIQNPDDENKKKRKKEKSGKEKQQNPMKTSAKPLVYILSFSGL